MQSKRPRAINGRPFPVPLRSENERTEHDQAQQGKAGRNAVDDLECDQKDQLGLPVDPLGQVVAGFAKCRSTRRSTRWQARPSGSPADRAAAAHWSFGTRTSIGILQERV